MKASALVLLILLPCLLLTVTRTVSIDGTQQYTSIQTAINACSNGDIVLVYPGRYIENINLNGHNITISSLYSQNPQQTYIDSTIIDGNLNTCITSLSGETYAVNGFTLLNNEQQLNHQATNNGGAFNIWYNCHVNIQNCVIKNCIAWLGGGISAGLGSIIEFSNVTIHSNRALQWGGGIRFGGGGQLLWNPSHSSSVYNNTAPNGMDFYIANCDNVINIDISFGSNILQAPDSFFILSYNNSQEPTINITNCFFPIIDNDIYISPDGNDNNSGLSSSSPFKTIKHALQLIKSNSDNPRTVHLSGGTFSFSSNGQLLPLSLKPHVRITGAGTAQTILDGELNNTFFAGWNMGDVCVSDMSMINGRSNNTRPIEISDCSDVEFRNLEMSNNYGYLNSGFYLLRSGNIILEDVNIGNTVYNKDLATIYATSCELYINNLISHDNSITDLNYNWLGLYFNESEVILRNTIICNNTATDAFLIEYQNIYPENADKNLDMSNVLIYNNNITNCSWAFAPVYLQNRYQSMKINNCTFAGNQGNGYFSAIFAYADIRNLISYNPLFTNEMYLRNHLYDPNTSVNISADVNISNSLFRTGSIPADLPNLVTLTDNIFNGNPLFLGTTTDTLNVSQPEYYYLSANSPCINAGTPDTLGLGIPPMDLAGNYRVWNGRIDMGCYEYGSDPYVSNENPEYPPLPDKINLSTYPNPVYLNGSKGACTFIEFTLPEKAKEPPVIEIYNIKGQKVRSIRLVPSYNDLVHKAGLSKEVKTEGIFYSTVYDCKDEQGQKLASGIYIVKVISDRKQASLKITLMK